MATTEDDLVTLAGADDAPDLDDPALYLNRELTWLAFNRRVLAQAENDDTPLLEQVKFLSIYDSNLDEFFMKRIGGLKHLLSAGPDTLTVDGRSPQQQLAACEQQVAEQLADRAFILRELLARLRGQNIDIIRYDDLSETDRERTRRQFGEHVLPLLTPLAIDVAHPFPFVSNLSVNLLLEVRHAKDGPLHLVRVKVPVSKHTPRFMQIGSEDRFVPLEDVIEGNIDLLLPGARVVSAGYFRVTRNAIVERDAESANDLLELIEAELRERRFAPVVRLEVTPSLRPALREYLKRQLGLKHDGDVYEVSDFLGASELMQIASLDRADLHYPPFEPTQHPRLANADSIFDELDRGGPILLKHPYQSFDQSVTRLLREAVADPAVLAIKTTVYRTSEDSAIVPLLVDAVQRGKQVAVVVELQARFDEAANIQWANRLEEAGIHVAYGVVGYKTHAKLTLIVRRLRDGTLRRYVHIGTGNYHSITARQYCDVGLLTSDDEIGSDGTELFNLLTSGSLIGRHYRRLLVSPAQMKKALIEKIEREMTHARAGRRAVVQIKTNALEDADLTRKLYEASMAGVQIDLVVRDSCRLRPGLRGLSENVRVISIVGRFLEHSRIYYFHNGGEDEYYIGSADAMSRNLEARVEALAPVMAPPLEQELRDLLDLQIADRAGGWIMDSDGNYAKRDCGPGDRHSQTRMMEAAIDG